MSMSKNPFVNALAAAGYISIFVTLVFNSPQFIKDSQLGMLAPILFLSAFVFSAALMGYLFVYQPGLLILEGKQAEGTKMFLMTVLSFALIIAVIAIAYFLLVSAL